MSSPSLVSDTPLTLNVSDLLLPPVNYTDVTELTLSVNLSSIVQESKPTRTFTDTRPPKEFPLALVIASPVVAVFILVFFCVSYYWHASYLDRQARKLAIRMAADAESGLRPSRRTRRGLGTDGRKSGRSRKLSSPTPSMPKRTSSAVTDQEILSHFAARRHSTFFI